MTVPHTAHRTWLQHRGHENDDNHLAVLWLDIGSSTDRCLTATENVLMPKSAFRQHIVQQKDGYR